jgi:hypothetical protein
MHYTGFVEGIHQVLARMPRAEGDRSPRIPRQPTTMFTSRFGTTMTLRMGLPPR